MAQYLTSQEIADFAPAGCTPAYPDELTKPLRDGLKRDDWFTPQQLAGRHFPMACIALEITQRCNLDCTLCYLSDLAEVVKDTPISELYRRIEMIHAHYGDYTNVQITGGDPTLRSIDDLVQIVKIIRSFNMRSSMLTNGIKASRKMLEAMSEAGLNDVVFHVDMTQERKGYHSEMELNTIRLEYMERAKGLPLRVLFNTTAFDGNMREIPELVAFFTSHADRINLASFQLQADTGRGVLRERDADMVSQASVMRALEKGTGQALTFNMPLIGHPDCNKYTAILTCGTSRALLYDDNNLFTHLFAKLEHSGEDWSVEEAILPRAIRALTRSPLLLIQAMRYGIRKAWQLRSGLLRRNKIHRISFFIHNFMDEEKLERRRCESCVFMVATADGPLSMCVHNAKRDEMISRPAPANNEQSAWNPLEPEVAEAKGELALPIKRLKGRMRQQMMDKLGKAKKKVPKKKAESKEYGRINSPS